MIYLLIEYLLIRVTYEYVTRDGTHIKYDHACILTIGASSRVVHIDSSSVSSNHALPIISISKGVFHPYQGR